MFAHNMRSASARCGISSSSNSILSSFEARRPRLHRLAPPLPAAAAAAPRGGGGGGGPTSTPPPANELVVGIDLGTTNSAVARVVNGAPVCIPNAEGDTVTPSVVAFLEGGETRVGRAARGGPPLTTYYSVKRLIGRTADDPVVAEEAARLAYEVGADEDGGVVLACPHVDPGSLYPEEVSALVVSRLLDDAAAAAAAGAGGAPRPTKAVVGVPAHFTDAQREATAAAGRLAGLETVRLIKEPVAAALAYGLDLDEEQVVLVVDLGGGTYDVSVLEVGGGTVEVLSTGGDAHLGGDDWDAAVAEWIEKEYLTPAGVDARAPGVAANLRALAEHAKVQLSAHASVALRMPVGGPDGGPLRVELTRAKFDALCEPLYRRARLPLDAACWQAGFDLNEQLMGLAEKRAELAARGVPAWKLEMLQAEMRPRGRAAISKVLLVGGATRMPSFAAFVANMTGITPEPYDGLDPDEAVALGAAVQAGILQGEVSGVMVMEQWQASLMRTLAGLQLKTSAAARARVEGAYDLEGLDGGDEAEGGGGGGDGDGTGEEGSISLDEGEDGEEVAGEAGEAGEAGKKKKKKKAKKRRR